jgi:hypothetical protein
MSARDSGGVACLQAVLDIDHTKESTDGALLVAVVCSSEDLRSSWMVPVAAVGGRQRAESKSRGAPGLLMDS